MGGRVRRVGNQLFNKSTCSVGSTLSHSLNPGCLEFKNGGKPLQVVYNSLDSILWQQK